MVDDVGLLVPGNADHVVPAVDEWEGSDPGECVAFVAVADAPLLVHDVVVRTEPKQLPIIANRYIHELVAPLFVESDERATGEKALHAAFRVAGKGSKRFPSLPYLGFEEEIAIGEFSPVHGAGTRVRVKPHDTVGPVFVDDDQFVLIVFCVYCDPRGFGALEQMRGFLARLPGLSGFIPPHAEHARD